MLNRWSCVALAAALVAVAGSCNSEPADSADSSETPEVTASEGGSEGSGEVREVAVERLIDGDSLEVRIDGVTDEVRLLGINAPELNGLDGQPTCAGQAGRDQLSLILGGGQLTIRSADRDRFDRLLAVIDVDGVAATESMVAAGWALALWSAEDPYLISLMTEAQEQGLGMWGDECGSPVSDRLAITDQQVNSPGDDRETLDQEWVEVTNLGPDAVDLEGWVIRDETTSNRFALEGPTLQSGQALKIRTGSRSPDASNTASNTEGSNPAADTVDLYLDEQHPVWSNRGETVLLVDPNGVIAAHLFFDGDRG